MTDQPVILFPHSYISESDLRRIFSFFGQVTICQPWFADDSPPVHEKEKPSFSRMLYPPESLKPKEDFHRLLSEYKLWVKQNPDKGYVSSLKASRELSHSEETPRNIRQMIQRAGEGFSVPEENNAFKWHLILHLTREFEKSQSEAEKILDKVKQQKPPLEGALEGGASLQGLFKDLPQFENDLFANEHHLSQVFEAWLGLFGEYLQDHGPLITLDRHVMRYATDIFEDQTSQPSEEEVSLTKGLSSIENHITKKHLPLFSDNGDAHRDLVLAGLSGKTIMLLEK